LIKRWWQLVNGAEESRVCAFSLFVFELELLIAMAAMSEDKRHLPQYFFNFVDC